MTARPTHYEFHMGRGWYTSENGLIRHVNRNDANGYYKTLGLKPDATREEIRAAYRNLVWTLHPDRGGDEELFMFIVEIAKVLLDSESKNAYDSVSGAAIYIGDMEREELARVGIFEEEKDPWSPVELNPPPKYWACLTDPSFPPGEDTDAWIDFCFQVSPAVGYRGKIRVGVIEGGPCWPCDPSLPWGILGANGHTFVVFQRGVEPNRLHALCAMIDWQRHLQNQIRGSVPRQERV